MIIGRTSIRLAWNNLNTNYGSFVMPFIYYHYKLFIIYTLKLFSNWCFIITEYQKLKRIYITIKLQNKVNNKFTIMNINESINNINDVIIINYKALSAHF